MEEQGGYFIIPFRVPSLNDYIKACRSNKYQGAQFKRDIEQSIGYAINGAVAAGDLTPCNVQCKIIFTWHEENKRRDADNIQSGQKYILDALQTHGIIKNDNRKWVENTYHYIIDTPGESKVVVQILPKSKEDNNV